MGGGGAPPPNNLSEADLGAASRRESLARKKDIPKDVLFCVRTPVFIQFGVSCLQGGWVQSGCRLCKPLLRPSFFAEYIQLDVVSQKASRYNSLRYVFIPLPQPNTCAKKDQIDSCCNHTASDNHTDNTKTQQRVQNYNHAQNAKQQPKDKRYPPV